MIREGDLKSSVDYSEGQKRAAHRVLVELVNIFQEYEDEIRDRRLGSRFNVSPRRSCGKCGCRYYD